MRKREKDFDCEASTAEEHTADLAAVIQELRAIRQAVVAEQAQLPDRQAAAAMLGVSTATLDRLRSAGTIPAPVEIPQTGMLRYRRVDLEKFVGEL